jgi:hypothetical protein
MGFKTKGIDPKSMTCHTLKSEPGNHLSERGLKRIKEDFVNVLVIEFCWPFLDSQHISTREKENSTKRPIFLSMSRIGDPERKIQLWEAVGAEYT